MRQRTAFPCGSGRWLQLWVVAVCAGWFGCGITGLPLAAPAGSSNDAGSRGPGLDARLATPDAGPSIDPNPCANGTLVGDVTIQTVADIARLKGCVHVTGDVYIHASALRDLRGLEALRVIDGVLSIAASNDSSDTSGLAAPVDFESLAGLEGLQSVGTLALSTLPITTLRELSGLQSGATLMIDALPALRDLSGLDKVSWDTVRLLQFLGLQTLDGLHVSASATEVTLMGLISLRNLAGLQGLSMVDQLTISGCDALRDLSGLRAAVSVGALTIEANAHLRTLDGLALRGSAQTISLAHDPELTNIAVLIDPSAPRIGSLRLRDLPALKDLSGLQDLQEAGSFFIENCPGLTDLSGLTRLKTVGQLELRQCANLQNLQGAAAIESITMELDLVDVPALTSLQGLTKLKHVARLAISKASALQDLVGLEGQVVVGTLEVSEDNGLQTLRGLENILELNDLTIDSNALLQNLLGLPAVDHLGAVYLTRNPQLSDLRGLTALRTVDKLFIGSNALLTGLAGVESLRSVSMVLEITDNDSLASLRAFAALDHVGLLDVVHNPRLPQCEVDWLTQQVHLATSTGVNGFQGTCGP